MQASESTDSNNVTRNKCHSRCTACISYIYMQDERKGMKNREFVVWNRIREINLMINCNDAFSHGCKVTDLIMLCYPVEQWNVSCSSCANMKEMIQIIHINILENNIKAPITYHTQNRPNINSISMDFDIENIGGKRNIPRIMRLRLSCTNSTNYT